MNAEIISVGSELLLGQIINTNAQFLSRQLALLGIDQYFQTVVGDNRLRLLQALDIASRRADIIIATGGLGPTADDLTKETIAEFLNLELALDRQSLERIESYFARMNRHMTDNNLKQAMFPKGAVILPNDNGTAPGAVIEKNGRMFVVLPGPPDELQPMYLNYVVPILKRFSNACIYSKTVNIYGIGESNVEKILEDLIESQTNPTIAPLAGDSEVNVRITAKAGSEAEAAMMINSVVESIKKRLGSNIYGYDDDSLEAVVISLLRERGYTLSLAESCTGGHISNLLTNVPGASEVFLEGCITYSNESKITRLGVQRETLSRYGAVSPQTAIEMADGIRSSLGSDIGMAVTGIAGPGGGSEEKPVGLVYMAISTGSSTEIKRCLFNGNRLKIKHRTAYELLNWLRLILLQRVNH
ncbi:MAG TPA: competence/damage-inducible protein A [Candidatus Atribacteria bacterium]|nr:competence/damage-inducible protein A [Candidatus Atribacteria bacterium]